LQYVLDVQTKELNNKIEDLNKISELDLETIEKENKELHEKLKVLELETPNLRISSQIKRNLQRKEKKEHPKSLIKE